MYAVQTRRIFQAASVEEDRYWQPNYLIGNPTTTKNVFQSDFVIFFRCNLISFRTNYYTKFMLFPNSKAIRFGDPAIFLCGNLCRKKIEQIASVGNM